MTNCALGGGEDGVLGEVPVQQSLHNRCQWLLGTADESARASEGRWEMARHACSLLLLK